MSKHSNLSYTVLRVIIGGASASPILRGADVDIDRSIWYNVVNGITTYKEIYYEDQDYKN